MKTCPSFCSALAYESMSSILFRSYLSMDKLDISDLQPCICEEANYCIMLHCDHVYRKGLKNIKVYATDTDILVSSYFHCHSARRMRNMECSWSE